VPFVNYKISYIFNGVQWGDITIISVCSNQTQILKSQLLWGITVGFSNTKAMKQAYAIMPIHISWDSCYISTHCCS